MKSILNLKQPILALAPIDGVSDNAFRFITKKYGKPDLMFTEFTNVVGLCIAGYNTLEVFKYDQSQRPIIGQIFGKEPEYFYHAAKIICALGFDGVDINMGCPAKTVSSSGSGAGLIRTPDLAREIIAACKKGVEDWVHNGELTGLNEKTYKAVIDQINNLKLKIKLVPDSDPGRDGIVSQDSIGFLNLTSDKRQLIPVSVKTRVGYDVPVTESWIKNLTKAEPAWISVHGRTLKQMYTGTANWNEIKIAVESTDLPVLANGDIQTKEHVEKVLELTGACGVLIARGSFGNPWVFEEIRGNILPNQITHDLKLKTLIEHTQKFVEDNPNPKAFVQMRKHFGWYVKGFDGAKEMREKLMRSNSLSEVGEILDVVIKN